jgi:DNA-binding XRE family transcriptional regulator
MVRNLRPSAECLFVQILNNPWFTTEPYKVNKKMQLKGGHVIAARGMLGLSQGELAQSVGVALITISRFEKGERIPGDGTLDKIRAELEKRGIEFGNGTGISVRLNYEKAAEYARLVSVTQPDSKQ